MDVSRRGLAGVVASAIAGGKEVANAVASMGAGIDMSLAKAPSLMQSALNSAEVAGPSQDPLWNHPLASAFRARYEYRRKVSKVANGYGMHPSITAIKSYSPIYRAMKAVDDRDEEYWRDALLRHLGLDLGSMIDKDKLR